ncbi:MAG: ABC transporter ATP-binding protein [Clostridiales bacterium]|nr:ABC transporter ATP-binding protein [Clostridiales bacterium]
MKKILTQNRKLMCLNVLLIIVCSILSISIAYFIQKIIDVTVKSDMNELKRIIFYSTIFLILYAIFNFLKFYYARKFQNNYIYQLRFELFKKIISKTPGNYEKYDSSDYLSILTNDIQLFNEGLLNSSILIVQNLVSAVITVAVLFYINPFIALVVIVCIIAMYFVPHIFGKVIQKHQTILSNNLKDLTALTKSYLNGFQVIFTYLIQGICIDKFAIQNKVVASRRLKMEREVSFSESLSAVLSIGTEFIVLFIAAWGVIHQSITIGTMVAIMQLSGAFIQPIMIIMQNIPRVIGGRSIVERFQQVMTEESTDSIGVVKTSFLEKIELNDVCFSYNDSRMVLKNINCTFEKGNKIAIVGGSGSGKSTLVGLITGLLENYKGKILFDDIELRDIGINQVLSFMTITQQNSFMFDSTILENITLGRDYDEDSLDQVCHMSGVSMFLDEVHDGLRCDLVESGSNLSGGQKQRISIARALYQKKPIMILDESTAAVDKRTAFDVENRLLNLSNLTLITITHNLDPQILQKYDKLLFLENGQISGFASFTNLFDSNERFRSFINISYDV